MTIFGAWETAKYPAGLGASNRSLFEAARGTHPEVQGITYIPGPNNKEPLKNQAIFQLKRPE